MTAQTLASCYNSKHYDQPVNLYVAEHFLDMYSSELMSLTKSEIIRIFDKYVSDVNDRL